MDLLRSTRALKKGGRAGSHPTHTPLTPPPGAVLTGAQGKLQESPPKETRQAPWFPSKQARDYTAPIQAHPCISYPFSCLGIAGQTLPHQLLMLLYSTPLPSPHCLLLPSCPSFDLISETQGWNLPCEFFTLILFFSFAPSLSPSVPLHRGSLASWRQFSSTRSTTWRNKRAWTWCSPYFMPGSSTTPAFRWNLVFTLTVPSPTLTPAARAPLHPHKPPKILMNFQVDFFKFFLLSFYLPFSSLSYAIHIKKTNNNNSQKITLVLPASCPRGEAGPLSKVHAGLLLCTESCPAPLSWHRMQIL